LGCRLRPIGQETYRAQPRAAYPFITLVPSSPSIPILINRNEGEWSGYWDHPVKCLVRVEQFDQHPDLAGRYALVEPRYVRAYFNPVP